MKIFLTIAAIFLSIIWTSCYSAPSSNAPSSGRDSTSTSSTSENSSTSSQSKPSTGGDYSKSLEAYNAKKHDEAVKGFQEVVTSDPQNVNAHYHLAKSFEGLKKDDDAINSYKEAIKIKPDHADSNFGAGSIYYKRKNYEASLPYFDQAAKTDYKSPKTLMALGDNQRMLKMFDRAIVQYGKVVGFEPNNANAYYAMGLNYIELKNKIAARQQVRKLESLDKGLAKKLADQIGK